MNIKRISPSKGVTNAGHCIRTPQGDIWTIGIPGLDPMARFMTTIKPQPIITEDIDYEIVEPAQLPPSNTNDNG